MGKGGEYVFQQFEVDIYIKIESSRFRLNMRNN